MERGHLVARKRPKASDVPPPLLVCLDGGKPADRQSLTPAETRALRRSAPLTHARLVEHFKGASEHQQRPG